MTEFRSGFVAIIGRPNAGKSTLLNALAGGKLAIVSSKPQTTRTSIQAVVTTAEAQIVFIDTPGIHASPSLLERRMMDTVKSALQDRDAVLFMTDCLAPFSGDDKQAVSLLDGVRSPVLLLLNKVDRMDDKRQLLPRIEQFQSLHDFAASVPISAAKGEGLDKLREAIVSRLPAGPQYFPNDFITDQPERFLAVELIREKILRETRQEVPHSIAVLVEKWEDTPRMVRIAATVYVERPGQKAIVIGAKGAMLKKIGTSARIEIESLLARKVFLELFVKVRPDWRESPEFLNAIDWRSMSGTELKS
ncbi:MAG: GTPase Era [Bryobacteraceae bacterium]